ncbi:universal stress protein [Cupriavidus metallidurans]|uniref:universal stress protein n=1 Tax=Cupriavidus metallidurans TaxID=119219 RepID=UPI001CD03E5C|nr:universal stress protein [Cupriavidus metallidurans]UBM12440.1 universal stress protein [Cupriavidus metallidurans]
MFKHILLPVDGSDQSRKAVSAAIEFARSTRARLTPYICKEEPRMSISMSAAVDTGSVESRLESAAREELSRIEAAAALAGVPCIGKTSSASAPHLGIIEKANELQCDVIFMASHGRKGLGKLLLGSVTQDVLSHSTIPVLVFR